jgi:hypothetical protein
MKDALSEQQSILRQSLEPLAQLAGGRLNLSEIENTVERALFRARLTMLPPRQNLEKGK